MLGSKKFLQFALLTFIGVLVLASALLGGGRPMEATLDQGELRAGAMLNQLMFAKRAKLLVDGQEKGFWIGVRSVADLLQVAGVSLGALDRVEPDLECLLDDGMEVRVTRVAQQLVLEEEVVPYRTVKIPSRSLSRGESRLVQPGVDGKLMNTYQVLYEDGKEKERVLVETETIVPKQDKTIEESTIATLARNGQEMRYSKKLEVMATAYTADYNPVKGGPDDPWKGMTASGKKAVAGLTIAADLKVLPMNTKVYIEGVDSQGKKHSGTYVVMDTGSSIKGNRIDIFMATYEQTKAFGRRKMQVYILE